jgi:hypothetical protein
MAELEEAVDGLLDDDLGFLNVGGLLVADGGGSEQRTPCPWT